MFQAEDGIRDAQESRGLGDVYKRQMSRKALLAGFLTIWLKKCVVPSSSGDIVHPNAVSYTHLTLPTIYSV